MWNAALKRSHNGLNTCMRSIWLVFLFSISGSGETLIHLRSYRPKWTWYSWQFCLGLTSYSRICSFHLIFASVSFNINFPEYSPDGCELSLDWIGEMLKYVFPYLLFSDVSNRTRCGNCMEYSPLPFELCMRDSEMLFTNSEWVLLHTRYFT